jgi:general nucleoside transport system ATP-binding protein
VTDALAMHGVMKRYPTVLAVGGVDFSVAWGEVHALIGENGAGKSTLMKILFGLVEPDAGHIVLHGRPTRLRSAQDAIRHGIGMVHQHFMLVEPLTVAENLILGAEPRRGPLLRRRAARDEARALIDRVGFELDPDARVGDLPVGLQQRVEILKALRRDARILIMDEPTAVLTPQEARGLFDFLRAFAAAGNAVIFISHKLDEVMAIADRISVMRDGRMVTTVAKRDTDPRQLAAAMVGRDVAAVERRPATPGAVRLALQGLTLAHPHAAPIDLTIRAGEIVGVAGIEGNGQSELVLTIAGLLPAAAGRILLDDRDVTPLSARARREAGLSHVPEDRNLRGLIGAFDATQNAILGDHHRPPFANRYGVAERSAIRDHAQALIDGYDVRPRDPTIAAQRYSGGNAQKLILARELERAPGVLLAAQPTRGVDIGAIQAIHGRIVAARDAGLAVLLVSADLSEIQALSDRIVVMYQGRIMGERPAEDADPETLGLWMAGATLPSPPPGDPR